MHMFTKEIFCSNNLKCTQKIAPTIFYYAWYKCIEKNCKKFGVSFRLLLNDKTEYIPDTDNESGKTYNDYFITAIQNTVIEAKDNLKGYPLPSGSLALYIFLSYSCTPSTRLLCLSIGLPQ